jgi:uncharacterized repeat protein (TIGR03803 family)
MDLGKSDPGDLRANSASRFSVSAYLSAMAVALLLAGASSQPAAAQTLTAIYNFKGDPDGAVPAANVIRDAGGNLYGTTEVGGTNNGTVFKIDEQGNETILHTFTGVPDGSQPWAGLVRDEQGILYGTTSGGGAFSYGAVFKIDSAGKESVVYSFAGVPDGATPFSGLTLDSKGDLYGTTFFGGTGKCPRAQYGGCGTVFKLSPDGTEIVLYSFAGGTDGALPVGVLLRDSQGNLYGTTENGGAYNCPDSSLPGCGTVFMLNATGTETILHSFAGAPNDGEAPIGGVTVGAGGNLYGTTFVGGTYNYGTVFELTRTGAEKLLYSFGGIPNDGEAPPGGVVSDPHGNLYGTTQQGGGTGCAGSGCGTLFRVTQGGKEISLPLNYGPAGCVPFASLIRDAAGNLYGTTTNCGTSSDGTVFELTP